MVPAIICAGVTLVVVALVVVALVAREPQHSQRPHALRPELLQPSLGAPGHPFPSSRDLHKDGWAIHSQHLEHRYHKGT